MDQETASVDEATRRVPKDTFGMRLVMLRHELEITVDEISSRCGIASATWSTWEHGTRPRDLVNVVTRISEETGYDREWLMWGRDFPLRREWTVIDGEGPELPPFGQGRLPLRSLELVH